MDLRKQEECFVAHSMEIKIRAQNLIKTVSIALHVTSGGDLIKFVQEYFRLDFKESLQKLNYDFNLNIKNFKFDIDKLNEIKSEKLEQEKEKNRLTKKYCELCDERTYFEKIYRLLKSKISFKNYENIEYVLSKIKMRLWSICEEMRYIDEKLSSRN